MTTLKLSEYVIKREIAKKKKWRVNVHAELRLFTLSRSAGKQMYVMFCDRRECYFATQYSIDLPSMLTIIQRYSLITNYKWFQYMLSNQPYMM